ncbi:villin, putative [Entamoeba invadens IP1]|uniref:villin, putative n=1 Tax=Entamoeba invadens IP1 TaxID=370355 RepID=UPI0002C3FB7E|nr:villin, putative [Entamoeba invadens IP1]ELP90809.1 villin, putative [Entamoeba invadens IP1]|eukprot:XP_004257580.1 villin, putative [Entamoeba invadens IP1]
MIKIVWSPKAMSDDIEKQEEEIRRMEEEMRQEEEDMKRMELELQAEEERIKREEEEIQRELEAAEAEKLQKEKEEQERNDKEKAEKEAQEKERQEKERIEKDRLEKERIDREAKEQAEKERIEKERLEKERIERERIIKEKEEQERIEKENVEKERIEKERLEAERVIKEKEEQERIEREAKERIEKENEEARIAKEKAEEEERQKEKEIEEEERRLREEEERVERELREEEERMKREEEELIRQLAEEESKKAEAIEKEKQEQLANAKKQKEEEERRTKEKEEQDRIEKEKREQQKAEEDRLEQEKAEKKRAEEERAARLIEEDKKMKEEELQKKQEIERLKKAKEDAEKKKAELEAQKQKDAADIKELPKDNNHVDDEGFIELDDPEPINNAISIHSNATEHSQPIDLDQLISEAAPQPTHIVRRVTKVKGHAAKAGINGNLKREEIKKEEIQTTDTNDIDFTISSIKATSPKLATQGGFSLTITAGAVPKKMNPLMEEMQAKRSRTGRASFSVKPSFKHTNTSKENSPSVSPALIDDPLYANVTFSNETDGLNTNVNYAKMVRVSGKMYMKWRVIDKSPDALNSGDAFMVDTVDKIYVWIGKDCNRLKRTKACDAANTIKHNERQGKCEIFQVQQGKEDEAFWTALGGKNENIKIADAKQDDTEDKIADDELFLLDEKKNDWDVAEIVNCTRGKMTHNLLYPWKIYVYDALTEVYVWVGPKSSQTLRKILKPVVDKIFESKQRPACAQIMRITQQTEPVLFKEKFAQTQGTLTVIHNKDCSYSEEEINKSRQHSQTVSLSKPTPKYGQKKEEKEEELQIDVREILGIPDDSIVLQPSKDFIIQGGAIRVFIVIDAQKEEIPVEKHGEFYSANDYIITYKDPKDEQKMFFWQGKDTSIKSRGTTSILVTSMSKSLGASTTRVPQGEEPHAFMQLFENKYLIHIGDYQNHEELRKTERLYQVSNTMYENTCEYTVQREMNKELIHSSSTYIYSTADELKVWRGKYASEKNFETAMEAVKRVDAREPTILSEAKGDFLFTEKPFALNFGRVQPKCFSLVYEKPQIRAKPMHHFTYQRLKEITLFTCENGIYLLVTQLKKDALTPYIAMIKEYENKVKDNYFGGKVPPIFVVHSLKHVPKEIAAITHGFVKGAMKGVDVENDPKEIITFDSLWDILNKKYTYEELLKRPTYLDKTKLETYLSDEDFEKVFKMKRDQFLAKKPFQQDPLKKEVKLF